MLDQDQKTDDGLTTAEQDYLHGRTPRSTRVERRRPGWVVVGLVGATFGLYVFFWVGLHWAEMKRQLQDERMYPIWHALSMLVPIYSYYQFYRNFSVLNGLLETSRSEYRVRPFLMVATFLLASLLIAVPIEGITLMTLNLIGATAAISGVIHYGQTGMNAYWDATPSVKTTSEVKLWERLVIAAGAGMWTLIIFGLLVEMTS